MSNPMLIQHVSSKVIRPLNPVGSNSPAFFNWTIHTITQVHCAVVPVKGLLRLEGSMPGAIRGLASKFT